MLTSGQAAPAAVLFIDIDNELVPTAGHCAEQSRELRFEVGAASAKQPINREPYLLSECGHD